MLKKYSCMLIIFFIGSIFAGCSSSKSVSSANDQEGKLQVVVSINPIKEFAAVIGGDKISVTTVVPEGVEEHGFELKSGDVKNINDADVFIYNGLGIESWLDDVLKNIQSKKLIQVDSSKDIEVIKLQGEEAKEHGEADPHIWLGLKEAKIQAKNIKDALVSADNANKDYYEANYNEFASKLDVLYEEYKVKFDSLSNKKFVTGHAAFGYLCRDFGLTQNSVENVFAEGEPTAKQLTELVEYCKENKIKVVFMEELASPKVSQRLADEIGAKVEKIYTIQTMEEGKDYLGTMEDNLNRIYESMK